ncbi:farnesol dehydrogenase-like [Anthonomus grandis grandis]|uniref:farnesol dehydrogenase-like n=1 Tax=Anthonomus grandis grandis TaxID=2921223 RepID=UPI002166130B|nr:farnesol dehydrogenase-like [Anthonomus grandis grandis]
MSKSTFSKYAGKVAVVTGASSGIGQAIAELLVKNGVIVAGVARRVERVQEHSNQLKKLPGKLHALKADLTKPEEIITVFKKITEELGPIYILINNAGLLQACNIIDGDYEKWKTTLDTNVLAMALACREAIKNMKEHNIKGHIINMNSVVGHQITYFPGLNVYPASKFAVTALTETLRLEINNAKLPIKITSVSPGYVKTEFVEVAWGKDGSQKFEQMPGLNSEDIADAVEYVLKTPDHVNIKELTLSVQGEQF